jgi:hypothetical protein
MFCLMTTLLLVSTLFVVLDTKDSVSASPPFSSDRMVSDANERGDQYYPDVAVAPNGTIYVAWEDGRNDPNPTSPPYTVDVFISSSFNRGGSFSSNTQITNHSKSRMKLEPSIAVGPDGTIFVAWWDNTGLYIQKSSDGLEFSDAVEVSTGVSGTFKVAPSVIAPLAGTVHVAYSSPDDQEGRIFLATSNDGGDTFASVRVDDALGAFRTNPDLVVGGDGSLHVVWRDERNGDSDVYHSMSVNGGQTFSPNMRVNDDVGAADQDHPSVAVGAGGNVYAVWRDWRRGNSDIFFSKSTDGGSTFGDGIVNDNDVEVDDYPFGAMHDHPSVAVDGAERIFVAWRDTRNGLSDQDIYFTSSEDGGLTFGDGLVNDNDIKVNDDLEDTDQEIPAMALTPDGSVCVVWYDDRNFASKRVDIYFSIFLGSAPDLMMLGGAPDEITFDPPSPQVEGTTVTITARVHNIGDEGAFDIAVGFFDDSLAPSSQIGSSESISYIPAGGNASVTHEWTCQGDGIHTILVFVDPHDEILEWTETNNIAGKEFIVLPIQNPAPPTDVSAALFGAVNTGVIVTWTLSLDDNGGRNTVERYDVHRGQDFDVGGVGYEFMGSVPKGSSNFVDQSGGYLDPNDYFYLVCATNSSLGSSCSLTQGAKLNIPVSVGWNLLSFPLVQWRYELELIFGTADFDVVRKYDAHASAWVTHSSSKAYSPLDRVDGSSGFWFHCLNDGNFTIAGQVPEIVELELRRGWNLVALPYFASDVRLADLVSMYSLKKAEAFDITSPPNFLREVGSLEAIDPKRAYWIQALEDVTMLVEN